MRHHRQGLISRQVFPTKPPSVEYRLTALGESLLEPLNALVAWAEANQARIGAARAAFDASALVAATALSRTEVSDYRFGPQID